MTELGANLWQAGDFTITQCGVKGDRPVVDMADARDHGMIPGRSCVLFDSGHQRAPRAPALRMRGKVDRMFTCMPVPVRRAKRTVGGKSQQTVCILGQQESAPRFRLVRNVGGQRVFFDRDAVERQVRVENEFVPDIHDSSTVFGGRSSYMHVRAFGGGPERAYSRLTCGRQMFEFDPVIANPESEVMPDTPFMASAVQAETQAFVDDLESRLALMPAAHEVPVELTRKARDEGAGLFPFEPRSPEGRDMDIPGAPGGPGRVRIFRPDAAPTGVFLHIHGGGWTLGRPWHQDGRLKRMVAATGCATVSVEYRLAPENPWPACVNDCAAAARWLIGAAPEMFGTDRIAIGGESAGAHLAATTLLSMKSEGKVDAFCGALMAYGAYDLTMTPSVANWGARKLVLSTPTIAWFTANLGVPRDKMTDPLVSPLYGDLSGMPPALFQCGTYDPLMDDTAFMAARWVQAGAEARTVWYPGGVHAFDYFDIPLARKADRDGHDFLRRAFTD